MQNKELLTYISYTKANLLLVTFYVVFIMDQTYGLSSLIRKSENIMVVKNDYNEF